MSVVLKISWVHKRHLLVAWVVWVMSADLKIKLKEIFRWAVWGAKNFRTKNRLISSSWQDECTALDCSAQWSKSIIKGWQNLFRIENFMNSNSLYFKAECKFNKYITPTKHNGLSNSVYLKKFRPKLNEVKSLFKIGLFYLKSKVEFQKVPLNCTMWKLSIMFLMDRSWYRLSYSTTLLHKSILFILKESDI